MKCISLAQEMGGLGRLLEDLGHVEKGAEMGRDSQLNKADGRLKR